MAQKKLELPIAKLKYLYWERNFSFAKIGKRFGCSWSTIANRFREHGVLTKGRAEMRQKYKKFPFKGTLEEKAYLMGFRLGDLNVYRPSLNSKIYVVRCHTTVRSQAVLVKSLFKRYGGVRICASTNGFTINCFLNGSFSFLYGKNYPGWVFRNPRTATAFTGGYTDAEGSFGVYQKRGRFKIDSYDFKILKSISEFLIQNEIKVKFWRIASINTKRYGGSRWNKDLWRLNINEAKSLGKFISLVRSNLRHKGRINQTKMILSNLCLRKKNGSI